MVRKQVLARIIARIGLCQMDITSELTPLLVRVYKTPKPKIHLVTDDSPMTRMRQAVITPQFHG